MHSFTLLRSFSHNSIYSIHYTYYSLGLSGLLSTFFMITFLFLSECFMFSFSFNSKYNLVIFCMMLFYLHFDSSFFICLIVSILFIYVCFIYSLDLFFSLLLIVFLFFVPLRYTLLVSASFILAFFLFMWINDFITECSFSFTRTEQLSLIFGIKLLILSEFMLFFCVFWTQINFRFILNVFSCFYALPLLSSFCFAIPYSNVIVLLFSSLPIQATIIFYKVGLFFYLIEQLGQTVSCGTVFLVLQLKEFFCSLHSITDCMIGSIFYFTTSLHGAHVILGLFYFYSILMLYFFALFSFSLQNTILYSSFSLNYLVLKLNFKDYYFCFFSFYYYLIWYYISLTYNWFFFMITYSSSSFLLISPYSSLIYASYYFYLSYFDCLFYSTSFTLIILYSSSYLVQQLCTCREYLVYALFDLRAFAEFTLIDLSLYFFDLGLSFVLNSLVWRLSKLSLFYFFSSFTFNNFFSTLAFHTKYIFFMIVLFFNPFLIYPLFKNNFCSYLAFIFLIDYFLLYFKLLSFYLLNLFYSFTFEYLYACFFIRCSLLLSISFSLRYAVFTYFFIEFSESLFYSSYYWHFVDIIWLIVFLIYFI